MKSMKSNHGFSLLELMVVVTLISVLAAIAIPNYQSYQGKARMAEARVGLASAFTAFEATRLETQSYWSCLSAMGFNGTTGNTVYYAIGFHDNGVVTGANCGATGGVACNGTAGTTPISCGDAAGSTFFQANVGEGGGPAVRADLAGTDITSSTYIIGAAGFVRTATSDRWSINEGKVLLHTQNGI